MSEIAKFNYWLSKQPHRHKIVIAGNHDLLFESDSSLARTQLTAATYLENSAVEIEGLRIWGSPQQPRFLDWAFNVDRGPAIRRYWDMIPCETDILVTHGPPFGILDTVNSSGEHLGSRNWPSLCSEFDRSCMSSVIFMAATGHASVMGFDT